MVDVFDMDVVFEGIEIIEYVGILELFGCKIG